MNLKEETLQKIVYICLMLKFTYGLVFMLAGVDKFLNLSTKWIVYVSPWIIRTMAIEQSYLLWFAGLIEIVLGILALTAWPKIAGYAIGIWLLLIACNVLCMQGYFDIAVRNVVMAMGAFALAMITDVIDDIVMENQSIQN